MLRPLQSLTYRMLHASLLSGKGTKSGLNRLSRRAFLGFTAALTSCATRPSSLMGGFHGGNESQQDNPMQKGPIPRNPSMRLDSNFSLLNRDITYTRALVAGKFIAMTFDDGPHPKNTPRLLNILRERNIKATFYVIGRSVEANTQVLRDTIAEGHEIGNHTQTHRLLTQVDDEALRWEMDSCRDAVFNASGYGMKTMRPPYGGLSQRQRQIVYNEYGYPTILWSVDPLDWKRPGPSIVASRILKNTTPGAIILTHDLHAPTVDAMPSTLDELLYRGYKFVTVSQLLAMESEFAKSNAGANPLNS